MKSVTADVAKTMPSSIVTRAKAGEEITLPRGEVPVAKIVPRRTVGSKGQFGAPQGKLFVYAMFFDPLPVEERGVWERS